MVDFQTMKNTTLKAQAFVCRPIGNQSTLDVPGVNPVNAGYLANVGIHTVSEIIVL